MQNKMTPNLNLISKKVSKFFHSLTRINVAPPKVALSTRVKDSAWYSHGKIYINPNYNPENLTFDDMIAHEFFHYVQKKMHTKYKKNLFESSAMFFAAVYVNGMNKNRIIEYLKRKEHMPQSGNNLVLLKFKQNKYNIKKTLLDLLN